MPDMRNGAETEFDKTVKQSKRRRRKGAVFALLFLAAVVVAGLCFCFSKLFFVKFVDIKDETEKSDFIAEFPYSEEEMFLGLGIEKDIGLYDFDANEAEERAKYNLPYIKEIKVSRRWPSTVVAKTILEVPSYYVSVDNDLYIVSDSLKVLEKTDDFEKIELYSLIHIECSELHSCIVGEKLGIPDDIREIIFDLEQKMKDNGVDNEISAIDVTNKFSLSVTYGTRYVVKLGDSKGLGTKLEFMKRIIEDREGDVIGGIIDVSDEKNREAIYKKFN